MALDEKLVELIKKNTEDIIMNTPEIVVSDMKYRFPRILDYIKERNIGASEHGIVHDIAEAFSTAYPMMSREFFNTAIRPYINQYKEKLEQIDEEIKLKKAIQEIKIDTQKTDAALGRPKTKLVLEDYDIPHPIKLEVKKEIKKPTSDFEVTQEDLDNLFNKGMGGLAEKIREREERKKEDNSRTYTGTVAKIEQAVLRFYVDMPGEEAEHICEMMSGFIKGYDRYVVNDDNLYTLIHLKTSQAKKDHVRLKMRKEEIEDLKEKAPILEICEKRATEWKKFWYNKKEKYPEKENEINSICSTLEFMISETAEILALLGVSRKQEVKVATQESKPANVVYMPDKKKSL